MCSSVTMSFIYSVPYVFMSFCLPFLCYHVFYILYPFGHSVFRSSVTMSFTYSIPSVILASVPLLLCLLHTLSLRSFWLLFLCYYVFTYSVPSVILASVPLLPCLLHTLPLMSLCHSGFINVKYFYKLPILSVTCEWQVGQYLPFLSRTFRDEFVSIKNTIVYKIKQRRQKSENRKFIY